MITLTESAASEVKRIMDETAKPEMYLRIAIRAGGCSGFQYDFGLTEEADSETEQIDEQHGVKLAVEKRSALYLDGTTVDFYEGIERRGFTFENPNVVKSCGCGSSFTV